MTPNTPHMRFTLPPPAAWPWLLVAAVLCAAFGIWFAGRQIALLDPTAANPPLCLMVETAARVALVAFAVYIYCAAYVTARSPAPFAGWLPLLGLLPLEAVFLGVSISWAMRLSLLTFLAVCLWTHWTRRAAAANRASDRHWIAFMLILVVNLALNHHFSPLHFHFNSFGWPEGYNFENVASSRLLQSYAWIKQFSLSSINYAYWGILPFPPINYESIPLRLMALLADSPSMDLWTFHAVIQTLIFLMFFAGAFGFYLLAQYCAAA